MFRIDNCLVVRPSVDGLAEQLAEGDVFQMIHFAPYYCQILLLSGGEAALHEFAKRIHSGM